MCLFRSPHAIFTNLFSLKDVREALVAVRVQGKQTGRPVRLFATQADNSASAAGAAPKLEQQASAWV